MNIENTLDGFHYRGVSNVWLQRFTVFTRILLAVGFVPPALVKIFNVPFTALPPDNPVGKFFEVFHQTTLWYEAVGWAQLAAAVFLLFPRTATLGALIYLPIITNICLVTNAIGFRGTWLVTILMLLANVYLLCWDYDKLKCLLPRRIINKAGATGRNFIVEPLAFGVFGCLVFMFFAYARVANLQELGVLGGISTFAGGSLFGLVCVWHRRDLRLVEK